MFLNLLTFFAAAPPNCSKEFLGLRPWYHYLPTNKFDPATCDIKGFIILPEKTVNGTKNSDIPLVLLAIADDLLRIAAIVAIAYVMVGAFQYVTSQGSPDKTAQAQSTIINALIGLGIAMIAVAFVSFVGTKLV